MNFTYLFSSTKGDIPVPPEKLFTPFKVTPSREHPFLTLEDYFEAIKAFILRAEPTHISPLLTKQFNDGIRVDDSSQALIRSEKHGALYHLASVEIITRRQSSKFAVCSAVSNRGKTWLDHEFDAMTYLNRNTELTYLPNVYFRDMIYSGKNNRAEPFSMVLAEWLEDFHEWHLAWDERKKRHRIRIWDRNRGNRFASKKERFQVCKQASKILTLYYDTRDFRQIYPWHHAAGDFVVKSKDGVIDVKLTTARRYEPVMTFLQDETINPFVAIVTFFLNLVTKMRLDKLDGTGEVVWAEDFTIEATTEGFFEALMTMEAEGRFHPGKVKDLLGLLSAFDQAELLKLFQPLLELYGTEEPDDLSVIKTNLQSHTCALHKVIQSFRL